MARTADLVCLLALTALGGWLAASRPAPAAAWGSRSCVELELAGLQNLNGKQPDELAALRQQAFERTPALKTLVPDDYRWGERSVFAGIGGGESWNGQFGTLYGTAANRVTGLSWESFVLLNPFVLGSLYSQYGSWSQRPDEELKKRWLVSEIPAEARWDGPGHTLTVRYQRHGALPEYGHPSGTLYSLNLINARDLGLNAFAILRQGSAGVSIGFDRIYPNQQRYVCDEVPGSAHRLNNLLYGPAQSEVVRLDRLPARVHLAFWREAEHARLAEPDFHEVIEITSDQP